MAAPRCTRVAKVMLEHAETLSHAVKRNGSVQYVIRAGSGELGKARAPCSAHVHRTLLIRYSGSSPTVVQDDEYTAGPN